MSADGRFEFIPGELNLGEKYFVSFAVGNATNSGAGIDFRDPCLSVAEGQPVIWYGEPEAFAGPDDSTCNTTYQLQATLGNGEGIWNTCSGPASAFFQDPQNPNSEVAVTLLGTYKFCWTETVAGCQDTDTVEILFKPPLDFMLVGSDILCEGEQTLLRVEGDFLSYEWNTGENRQFLVVDTTGTYCVTVTDDSGCTGEKCIRVNEVENPQVIIDGRSEFCAGDSVELKAGSGYKTYRWDNGASTESIFVTETGNYCVSVTDLNDCEGTACFEVTRRTFTSKLIDTTICFRDTFAILGQNLVEEGQYDFRIPGGNQWGCDSLVFVDLHINSEIVLEDTLIVADLGGNEGSISVVINGGTMPYKYNWSNGGNTALIRNLKSGDYQLTVTDGNGCEAYFEFEVPLKTSVKFPSKELIEMKVIPNPSSANRSTRLWMQLNQPFEADIEIWNSQGQIRHRDQQRWSQGKHLWELPSGLESGWYVIVLKDKYSRMNVLPFQILN